MIKRSMLNRLTLKAKYNLCHAMYLALRIKRSAFSEMADILAKKYKEAGWWKEASPKRALTELNRYTF